MSDLNVNNLNRREIRVPALPRVEGEGGLLLELDGQAVVRAQMRIYEPPRFFESFLRGRDFREVPDIVARICGICPVAYQMSASQALERALGVSDAKYPGVRLLRDLLYCGEWIESHVLHIFMLSLPDFLGYESVITMAADHAPLVKRALRIKKAGNAVVSLLGGRSVHPVGACVGGFYKSPELSAVRELLPEVRACCSEMCDLTLWLAGQVKFPAMSEDYELLSLSPLGEYPMNRGRILSSKGLDLDQDEFDSAIEERQAPHSTALVAQVKGRGAYLVGPLARLNLNHEKLHPQASDLLKKVIATAHAPLPWMNIYLSLLARAVETVHALALAGDCLEAFSPAATCRIPLEPRAGAGAHGTEAPRGLCWHRYRLEADGTVAEVRIIPPTSQNQAAIERDLATVAKRWAASPDAELAGKCEQMVRSYDPCISCAVHCLTLKRRKPAEIGGQHGSAASDPDCRLR